MPWPATEQAQDEGAAGESGSARHEIPAPTAAQHDRESAERAVSWKIEVVVDDSGEWESDPFRFETLDEALAYARDLELRWAAVRDRRVVKSLDPVNRRLASRQQDRVRTMLSAQQMTHCKTAAQMSTFRN